MMRDFKNETERPTSATTLPPPAEDLRHVDRLATFGLLAAGIVHELGATLDVASKQATAIANGDVEGDEARTAARIIGQQLDRIAERFNRLLGFAHDEPAKRTVVDIGVVVRRVAELFVPLAAKRRVTVRMGSGDRLEAMVDPLQIEQVVAAIVLNAIQASPPNGAVDVSVRATQDGEARGVCIEVADDGPGIAKDLRPKIFEPFFTTKDPGQGTGLGLSVANAIVRDHGGFMELETEPSRGCRVRVHLPVRKDRP